jgi:hypothetical protein
VKEESEKIGQRNLVIGFVYIPLDRKVKKRGAKMFPPLLKVDVSWKQYLHFAPVPDELHPSYLGASFNVLAAK